MIAPTSSTLAETSRLNNSIYNHDELHACSGKLSVQTLGHPLCIVFLLQIIYHMELSSSCENSVVQLFSQARNVTCILQCAKQLINVISGKHNKTQFSQGCIWNIRIMFNILLIVSQGKS